MLSSAIHRSLLVGDRKLAHRVSQKPTFWARPLSTKSKKRSDEAVQVEVGADEGCAVVGAHAPRAGIASNESLEGEEEGSRAEVAHDLKMHRACEGTSKDDDVDFGGVRLGLDPQRPDAVNPGGVERRYPH